MKQKKEKHYPEEYLALAIVLLLLIELGFANFTQVVDWRAGFSVLDVSDSVSSVSNDLSLVFQPIADTVSDVDLFYRNAAAQTAYLLQDDGNFALPQVVAGTIEFYAQTSEQMAQLLDFSSPGLILGNVAGTSVEIPSCK